MKHTDTHNIAVALTVLSTIAILGVLTIALLIMVPPVAIIIVLLTLIYLKLA